MKKTLSIIMLFLTLSFGLIACGDSNYIDEQEKMIKEQKEEPIFASYSVEEITNMTEDERDELCLNHHIEVYGIVYDTQAKIQFGDDYEDEFNINCTLNDTDILDEIVIGDFIRLEGVCFSSYTDEMYLKACDIIEHIPTDEPIIREPQIALINVDTDLNNYEDQVKAFKEAGFTNVIAEPVEIEDTNSEYEENCVIEISIDNESDPYHYEYDYRVDTPIIVYYRMPKPQKQQEIQPQKEVEVQQSQPEPKQEEPKQEQQEPISSLIEEPVSEDSNIQKSTQTEDKKEDSQLPQPEPAPAPTPQPEPQPTPQPQPESNSNSGSNSGSSGPSVIVPDHEEAGPNLVWVPTKGGKKYHTGPGCSNMEDPMQVTVETAEANGYTPCKRCH